MNKNIYLQNSMDITILRSRQKHHLPKKMKMGAMLQLGGVSLVFYYIGAFGHCSDQKPRFIPSIISKRSGA